VSIPSAKTYAWFLALLRIYAGLFWLSHAIPKFTNASAFLPPNGSMSAALTHALAVTHGPYHSFLMSVVQPNAAIFAQLIRLGELATGALLLLGLLTRLGGLLGVVMGILALLAQGYSLVTGWSSIEAAAIALSAISLALPTGRVFGIDAVMKRRSSAYDDTPAMPVPPARMQSQPEVAQPAESAPKSAPASNPVVASPPPPLREPGPNGANGGPAFAAPASAGPIIDQGTPRLT
jgi:uncharacterized membrane protein YphA (DoxX/SURF4 family)